MKTLTLLSGLLICIGTWGQASNKVMVHGHVFSADSRSVLSGKRVDTQIIQGAQIVITAGDSVIHQQMSSSKGYFAAVLEEGTYCTLTISKPGHLTRTLTIDATELPETAEIKVLRLITDATLYTTPKNLKDHTFEDTVMGHARYIARHGRMEWDQDFARSAFERMMRTIKSGEVVARREP